MRKICLTLYCLFIIVAVPLHAAQPSNGRIASEAAPQLQFSNPWTEVMVAYARISAESGVNRNHAFARLSPSMQADIWILHLDFFLQDHEDLTPRQRTVIYDAIRFIGSGPFNITPENEAWKATVERPLKALETRALTAFGATLAYEAFAHLGPQDPFSNLAKLPGMALLRLEPESAGPGALGAPLPDCECATDDDWCCVGDCLTSATPKCHPNLEHCMPHTGCGWLWLSSCNGNCGA